MEWSKLLKRVRDTFKIGRKPELLGSFGKTMFTGDIDLHIMPFNFQRHYRLLKRRVDSLQKAGIPVYEIKVWRKGDVPQKRKTLPKSARDIVRLKIEFIMPEIDNGFPLEVSLVLDTQPFSGQKALSEMRTKAEKLATNKFKTIRMLDKLDSTAETRRVAKNSDLNALYLLYNRLKNLERLETLTGRKMPQKRSQIVSYFQRQSGSTTKTVSGMLRVLNQHTDALMERKVSGGSLWNNFMVNFGKKMPELHYISPFVGKHQFSGPFTNLDKRLKKTTDGKYLPQPKKPKYAPKNKADAIAMRHDIAYSNSDKLSDRHKADGEMLKSLSGVIKNRNGDANLGDRFDSAMLYPVIWAKRRLGLGGNNSLKEAERLAGSVS